MIQVRLRKIKFADNVYITKLLKSTNIEKIQGTIEKCKEKEEEILGAMGIDLKRKKIIIFKAKCIILATGGYTNLLGKRKVKLTKYYRKRASLNPFYAI